MPFHWKAEKMKCPNCDGIGKILDQEKQDFRLPPTYPTQPGITCPVCNGLRTIERQTVIPGAEKATPAQIAQRRASAPLKPAKPQRPCDAGLFSDDANQTDLVDFISQQHKPEGYQ